MHELQKEKKPPERAADEIISEQTEPAEGYLVIDGFPVWSGKRKKQKESQ